MKGESNDDQLLPNARAALELRDQERILFMPQPHWIGYTRSKEILARLEALLRHPTTHRMPNLLIIGETNNGKTMLVRRFAKLHPIQENAEGQNTIVPVLLIQAPPVPDEGRFYNMLLEALHAPYRPNESVAKKHLQVTKILQSVQLRMLIIDEIHHLLAGSLAAQHRFLNVLKYLGNDLQIPIVGVGTVEAIRAVAADPQTKSRFEPVVLKRWELDRDFLSLLASFEKLIPLREASGLADQHLALKLLSMSEGTIGELNGLLAFGTERAIQIGRERIDVPLLRGLDWVPPSERGRHAAGMV